ncbi:hypothetical protein HZH66_006741 [Vespula vulgaris]|uniref:Uncharacterized protein n=2 Tax=Vespula TaxID=7451 RepID=A0A834K1U8_VESVU|nr:hypothetical protein HZH66_006741 [Vespula vulgaris]
MAGELWRTQGKEGTSRAGDIVLALTTQAVTSSKEYEIFLPHCASKLQARRFNRHSLAKKRVKKKQERWPSKWARVHVLEGEEFISPAHSWDKEWGLDLPDGFTPNTMQRRYRESDFPSSVHDNKHRDCHASF